MLQPIADSAEMGLSLESMEVKLRLTSYYAPLFAAAFGTPKISRERVALALAQFVRSFVSTDARLDAVFRGGGPPDLAVLTPAEREGRALFNGTTAGCLRCHRTNGLELDLPDNIGLDSVPSDTGAGGGRFKTASLRNVAVRPPYMHDGRFRTLDEVVAFYDSGSTLIRTSIHAYAHPTARRNDSIYRRPARGYRRLPRHVHRRGVPA